MDSDSELARPSFVGSIASIAIILLKYNVAASLISLEVLGWACIDPEDFARWFHNHADGLLADASFRCIAYRGVLLIRIHDSCASRTSENLSNTYMRFAHDGPECMADL